jgi:hypothetical protein
MRHHCTGATTAAATNVNRISACTASTYNQCAN